MRQGNSYERTKWSRLQIVEVAERRQKLRVAARNLQLDTASAAFDCAYSDVQDASLRGRRLLYRAICFSKTHMPTRPLFQHIRHSQFVDSINTHRQVTTLAMRLCSCSSFTLN